MNARTTLQAPVRNVCPANPGVAIEELVVFGSSQGTMVAPNAEYEAK